MCQREKKNQLSTPRDQIQSTTVLLVLLLREMGTEPFVRLAIT